MIIKNKIIHFLMITFAFILIDFVSFGIAESANDTQIIIDENLKPGMPLKEAIELLGPPEKVKISNNGTIVIPYDTLGLSVEVMSDGSVIERIHLSSSFKGQFASGIEIGADFQKILSAYNQPDIMTKEIIEYSDLARIFQLHEGKLIGADLYSGKNTSNRQVSISETVKHKEVPEVIPEDVHEEVREEVREELREELREEVLAEVNKEVTEEFDVFDLYGFKVKNSLGKVIITEIRPDSVAENGGLKAGAPVRKAFYKGAGKLNIYSVSGLEAILKRAIVKHKQIINILQDKNYYYKVEVPKRK